MKTVTDSHLLGRFKAHLNAAVTIGEISEEEASYFIGVLKGCSETYPKKSCGTCKWFSKGPRDKTGLVTGECIDAVARARETVPFAVNLNSNKIYEHGGRDCPCFEPRKP
jgi:hypothetical protein